MVVLQGFLPFKLCLGHLSTGKEIRSHHRSSSSRLTKYLVWSCPVPPLTLQLSTHSARVHTELCLLLSWQTSSLCCYNINKLVSMAGKAPCGLSSTSSLGHLSLSLLAMVWLGKVPGNAYVLEHLVPSWQQQFRAILKSLGSRAWLKEVDHKGLAQRLCYLCFQSSSFSKSTAFRWPSLHYIFLSPQSHSSQHSPAWWTDNKYITWASRAFSSFPNLASSLLSQGTAGISVLSAWGPLPLRHSEAASYLETRSCLKWSLLWEYFTLILHCWVLFCLPLFSRVHIICHTHKHMKEDL